MHPPIKTVVLLSSALVFIILSFHSADGTTIVRIKKPRHVLEPRHIQSLVQLNHGVYAREYGYEKPLGNFVIKKRIGRKLRKKRNRAKKKVGIVPWAGVGKTYARKYKTWAPSKDIFTANHIVLDERETRPHKKRRRPSPVIIDDDLIQSTSKKRRRIRPNRPNHLQRPSLPSDSEVIYEEYDGEYFPEETKRLEIDYDVVDDRFRPKGKKRRQHGLRKKKPKKPELSSKFPFDDDSRLTPDGRYKPTLGEPSISYSNFIQHPIPVRESDYDYPEEEESRYVRNESRKKRKRVKKKSSSRDRKREKTHYRPEETEEDVRIAGFVPEADRYPVSEEPDYPIRSSKPKKNKIRYESTSPVYGDGHISSQNSIDTPRFPSNFARPEIEQIRNYQPAQNNFPQSYSRPVQQNSFSHPIYENNFDNQINNQIRFNQGNSRPYQPSTPVFNPADYVSQNVNPYQQNTFSPSSNYNNYAPNNGYSNTVSSGTYQQPVYTRNPVSSSNSFQNSFKSNPVFDNTESFYDFNNNANVNSQQSKHSLSTNDYLQKYSSSNRLNTIVPNNADADNDFIAKHQNLYNNGLNGVPVQGDGFGSNRNQGKNKDYDIGYGEFQFDENNGS